ncbi:MAG: cytochrome b/b6 domain-containing protein, partial [Pseudomonadota bacterium]
RLFHWSLAASVLGAFATVNAGDMGSHMLCGFAALTLVGFRMIWGLIGSETSQFRDFVRKPREIRNYLRRGQSPTLGHNPLGGLSVVALLLLVAIQALTGLFANDGESFSGPWAELVGTAVSNQITGMHQLTKSLLLGLIVLHVLAIAWYLAAKNEELLSPMLHGQKQVGEERAPPRMANPLIAAGVFVGVAAITAALFRFWLF